MFSALTITVGWWVIPGLLTAACLVMMFRPYQSCGSYDFGLLFRVLWLAPIAVVWLVYALVLLWLL